MDTFTEAQTGHVPAPIPRPIIQALKLGLHFYSNTKRCRTHLSLGSLYRINILCNENKGENDGKSNREIARYLLKKKLNEQKTKK